MNLPTLGTDIESVSRFLRYAEASEHRFLKRFYTESELAYCFSTSNPSLVAARLAARFCVKEAAWKALSAAGEASQPLKALEVLHAPTGSPCLRLPDALATRYAAALSLSHCDAYATATVLLTPLPQGGSVE